MNLADIILLLAISALAGLALWFIFKRKKRGGGCCGGCSGCSGCSGRPHSGACPSARRDGESKKQGE